MKQNQSKKVYMRPTLGVWAVESAESFLAGSPDVYMPGSSEGDEGFDDPNDNNAKRTLLEISNPWES